jgi:phosphoglycerate dehydrogenase-like enzyme
MWFIVGTSMRILLCGGKFPHARSALETRLPSDELIVGPPSDLRTVVAGVDAVVPFMSQIDAALMDAGRFRLIQQFGTGLEGVDLDAARARGIWVANAPASATGNAESVAEHAILLILAVLRQLPRAQANVREEILGAPIGRALQGLTVCLLGLGGIAGALAARLHPFGVRLIGITRRPDPARSAALGLSACYALEDREAALHASDILVVCIPVTSETRGIVDARALSALPTGACVINVARGPLVDHHALCAALASGHLGGAGLDVYWREPVPPDDPLFALPNVVATPHIAGVTDRSYAGNADVVAMNIERLRRGEPPAHRVV